VEDEPQRKRGGLQLQHQRRQSAATVIRDKQKGGQRSLSAIVSIFLNYRSVALRYLLVRQLRFFVAV